MNAYVTGLAARQTPVFVANVAEKPAEQQLSRAEAYIRAHEFVRPTLVIDTQAVLYRRNPHAWVSTLLAARASLRRTRRASRRAPRARTR